MQNGTFSFLYQNFERERLKCKPYCAHALRGGTVEEALFLFLGHHNPGQKVLGAEYALDLIH